MPLTLGKESRIDLSSTGKRCLTIIATSLLVLLVGCQPSGVDDLARKYQQAPDAYAKLKTMIIEDTPPGGCFEVGTDKIGDHWLYGKRWVVDSESPPIGVFMPDQMKAELPVEAKAEIEADIERQSVFLQEALAAESLAVERYDIYLSLLKRAGGERVTHCFDSHKGRYASVLVFRSGLVVSGCIATIEWGGPLSESSTPSKTDDSETVVPLKDGWVLRKQCT